MHGEPRYTLHVKRATGGSYRATRARRPFVGPTPALSHAPPEGARRPPHFVSCPSAVFSSFSHLPNCRHWDPPVGPDVRAATGAQCKIAGGWQTPGTRDLRGARVCGLLSLPTGRTGAERARFDFSFECSAQPHSRTVNGHIPHTRTGNLVRLWLTSTQRLGCKC